MKKKETENNQFSKYIKWLWLTIFGGTLALIFLFLLASWGVFGALPSFEELENPEKNLATEVISIDGKTLGKYAYENRTPVKYKDLPQNLINALIATEDERFYEHSGIDFKASLRAVVKLGKEGIEEIKRNNLCLGNQRAQIHLDRALRNSFFCFLGS